jgi:hypothetical protein
MYKFRTFALRVLRRLLPQKQFHSSETLHRPSVARPDAGLWFEILAMTALLGVLWLITLPGMSSPLLLDDNDQMEFVSRFSGWGDCFGRDSYGYYRPVKNLLFFGIGHSSNASLHCFIFFFYLTSVVAVYVLLRRLLHSPVWALLATVLWATCPTQVSAAVWMSCANISLSVVLTCTCLYFHDRSRDDDCPHNWQAIIAVLFLFLAQCSYESAVAVPGLCVLVDALRRRPVFSKDSIIRYGIYGFVTLVYLWVRFHAGALQNNQQTNLGFAPDLELWQLSVSAPWFLWQHFSMWLMPPGRIEFLSSYLWGISASPAELAGAWAWLLGILTLIVMMRKREPWIAFGLLWFLFASFPSSNMIPIRAGPIEDYYLIVPSMGLAIALLGCARQVLAWITVRQDERLAQRKLAGGALLAAALIWRALGLPLFWYQANLWNRPAELFINCDLIRPGQYQVQTLAANEIFHMGDIDQAEELAKRSYATAPWYFGSSMLLGQIELIRRNYDEAIRYFDVTLRLVPKRSVYQDFNNLNKARALMARQENRHLVRETLLPVLTNPGSSSHLEAVNLLVDFYLADNKLPEARKALVNGMKLHPANALLADRLKDIDAMATPPLDKGADK